MNTDLLRIEFFNPQQSVFIRGYSSQRYEHQNPCASVVGLMMLHLPGVGLPVVPHALQIQ